MSSNFTHLLETVHQLTAPLEAVAGGVVNRFSRALDALRRVADRANAPLAIVGGLAAIHHGVSATTVDIDIVVASDQLDKFLEAAIVEGLVVKRRSQRGWHSLEFPDAEGTVNVEVIPSGEKSPRDPDYAPPTPTPPELGVSAGVEFASFAAWIALKLVANRDKDRYHVVEALKHATADQVAAVVVRLRSLHPAYLKEFERMVQAAESERHETW